MRKEKIPPVIFFNPSDGFHEVGDKSKTRNHAKCRGLQLVGNATLSDEDTEAQENSQLLALLPPCVSHRRGLNSQPLTLAQNCSQLLFSPKQIS